jgi:adenylylsulfate kinase
MYKKARNNEIKAFTGVSDPYEAPEKPDLVLDTEKETLEQSVQSLLNFLKSKNLLNGSA